MPEYPRSPFKKTATSITPKVDGDSLDATVIGETTPAAGNFTTLDATGQLQGALINNQMVQKATFDILGLMTDPRFLNLQCEDPGAGTMTDASGQGHDGTYEGSMTTGDRVKKGMGWSIDFDGTNDYITLGDADDFSFGDGSNDEAVTWFGVIEVDNSGPYRTIMAKFDETTASKAREWRIALKDNNTLRLQLCDESADAVSYRVTDAALSVGWHTVSITSPGDGGATAMDNVKIYIDGVLTASTVSNSGSYVAMENSSTSVLLGTHISAGGIPGTFMLSNNALTGIDGSEWSAYDVHRFHQLCQGLYGL